MEARERTAATPRGRRRAERGVVRVWALFVALLVVALALFLVYLRDADGLSSPFHLPWWTLAPLFFVTESTVIRVRYRGRGQALAINEIPLVLGLFFSPPGELLVALLLGSAAAVALRHRQSPQQMAFNTSNFFLGGVLAVIAFERVVVDDPLGPRGWSGALLASVVLTVISHTAITVATLLSGSRPDIDRLVKVLSLGLTASITSTMVSLIAVSMLWRDRRSALLLVVPVAMGVLAYRAYREHRAKADTLDLIYESTRMLHRSPEVDSALAGLLGQARAILRAERAEITLMPADDVSQAVRTTLGPGDALETMTRVDLSLGERQWAESLPTGSPCFCPDIGRPLPRALRERGIAEAMAVAVHRGTAVVATILVANRTAGGRHFEEADLEVFRAITQNVAVVLETGRLEQSLQQLRVLEEQLEHHAYHDHVTGLPNRLHLIELIDGEVEFDADAAARTAVVFIDLDDFKVVNDVEGHEAGDALLRNVASVIGRAAPEGAFAAHMAGDEFAVLLRDVGPDTATAAAAAMLEAIRTINGTGGRNAIHATAGIAFASSAANADELLRNADVAMSAGKQSGKNQVQRFSPDMHVAVVERHGLVSDLQRAVQRDEFVLYYQPIVSLDTERLVAFEVLVRWQHPRRGVVQPSEFIPIAEESDLILDLGRLVLAKACAQAREWQLQYPEHADVAITVNLSAKQLHQPSFVGETVQLLAETRVRPESLVLEITESVLMEDPQTTVAKLLQLKHLGVRVAMDDFGTGYSSLSFLAELPVDILKVAKPFTEGLGRSERETAFAEAIVKLGRTVGMRMIAEGVESTEQADALRAMGCDMGQGYLYAEPRDASYVEHLLRNRPVASGAVIPFPA